MIKSIKLKQIKTNVPKKKAFFIEGGGTKGIYAIGVLKYLLEKNSYLDFSDVEIVGGTSVGTYVSVGISLGYDAEDLIAISKMIDLSKLVDSKYLFLWTAFKFFYNHYLYSDSGRKEIVSNILNIQIGRIQEDLGEKVKAIELTFGHLRKLIEKKPNIYKHFIVNSVDINMHKQIFFTTLDNRSDNIKLYDALLASSALPLIFEPTVLYHYPDGTYGYTEIQDIGLGETNPKGTKNNLIDGGTSTNNPLDYFLINEEIYDNYDLWLLKFTAEPKYIEINSISSMFGTLMDYLISGKNDIKMKLIEEEYEINIINLKLQVGILEIYDQQQIQNIIKEIYQKISKGQVKICAK